MKYVNIPVTTLNPSAISLGTNRFGSLIDRDSAFKLLDAYIELGGTFIDTAHIYADWIPGAPHSASEKTIGEWLRQRNCRAQIVLATKVGHPNLKSMHISRLSARELLDDLFESLEFLQTDYVDLLWLHRDDPGLPVGEIVDAMNQVLRTGKARYIGCSNWRAPRIREANEYARMHNLCGFIANQPQWS
jgi:aryl-alcohol dehydrogenase-like predicted oxidoreductase